MEEKKAVIVIPTYNESESINKIITYLFNKTFKEINNWKIKMLIVDARSTDNTEGIVRSLMKKYDDLDIFVEDKKEGIGAAYIKGFKYAIDKYNADVLIEFDGDFQHPPETIPVLLNEIDNGFDYVIGSRRVKGGGYPKGWGFKRNFLSRFGGFVARLLLFFPFKEFFKVTDPTTGLKATRVKGAYSKINLDKLKNKGFGYKIELLFDMLKYGARIKEIPLNFKIREAGESKITNQTPAEIFKTVFYLRFHDEKTLRFIKFCFVGLLGLIINSVLLEIFARSSIVNIFIYIFSGFKNIPVLNVLTVKSSWSAGLAAEAAIISNFIFNNLWTFYNKKIEGFFEIIGKFIMFNFTSIGAVLIEFLLIGLSVIIFGESSLVRQFTLIFVILFVIVPYNWFMYNVVIWSKKLNIVDN